MTRADTPYTLLHSTIRPRRAVASVLVAAAAMMGLLTGGCAPVARSVRAAVGAGPLEVWEFTAPWDRRSAATIAEHGAELDGVVSGFISIDSATFRPTPFATDSLAMRTERYRVLALVSGFQGTRFHPETIRALASDPVVLGQSAGETARLLQARGYRGAVLDFEGLGPADLDGLLRVTHAFTDSARVHGVAPVGLAVPASDTLAYPARPLLSVCDFLVVMLYDQHWATSPPGPIATPDWVTRTLGMRVGEVGPSRLVAALPTYGYAWRADSATAVLSFDDAVRLARDAHTELVRDPASATLHAAGARWDAWVSDAVQLDTLLRVTRAFGVSRLALWRAGLEDPGIWPVLARERRR